MTVNIGKLVVVTGFSGAGKDTLIERFLTKRSDFEAVVTHSTRPQRKGEIPGVHHHFVSFNEFESLIQKGEMLEYVKYGSFYKGTTKSAFSKVKEGKNIVWRVDILRAATYEETFSQVFDAETSQILSKKSVRLFVKTPSHSTSFQRYVARDEKSLDIEEFKKRLKRDIYVYDRYKHKFPYIIVNKTGRINQSLSEMERIIDSI